jgi:hypothetical protein
VCSKKPTLDAVARRLIKLSVRLPYSAVHDADEEATPHTSTPEP